MNLNFALKQTDLSLEKIKLFVSILMIYQWRKNFTLHPLDDLLALGVIC